MNRREKAQRPLTESELAPLTVAEAAKLAKCGPMPIRRAIENGDIPRLPIGRTVKIPRAAFMRWLDEGTASEGELRRA
jgi:excisionase family DNA binding protein